MPFTGDWIARAHELRKIMNCENDEMPKTGTGNSLRIREAKFQIGQVVRHRIHPFRGVIFDVDPEYDNTDEWWESIPEDIRPSKDQPFYHLLAENKDSEYIAYVSEQNLVVDQTGEPMRHPQLNEIFDCLDDGSFRPRDGDFH